MTDYRHCVAGFFPHLAEAEATLSQLVGLGLPRDRLQIFKCDPGAKAPASEQAPEAGSNAARKDMLVDGAIGGAVGIGVGAVAELALVAANVSLFIASPLLAPLVLLGWGATVGATIGAAIGVEKKEAPLSALIRDAVANGQVVLVAETQTEQETADARAAIEAAVVERKDVTAS